jgi:hypothetical protein
MNWTAATGVVPLTTLILGACVSQSTYEQQTRQLQQAQAPNAEPPAAKGCGEKAGD